MTAVSHQETRTFSGDAKDSLARQAVTAAHCRTALRDGLLFFGTDRRTHAFRTQRPAIARLLWSLLDDRQGRRWIRVGRMYAINVPRLPENFTSGTRCDRRLLLRAAFLACGSLSVPRRGYHLEFIPPDHEAAQRLEALLHAEDVVPKASVRKGRRVVYFKEADAIARVLAAVGAGVALLHLENRRVLGETKNRIRRLVNTEAANVDRATSAAATQREAIGSLAEGHSLGELPFVLRRAAELRLAHPAENLTELGRRCDPPAGKSTMGARMAALTRLADQRAAALRTLGSIDEPTTDHAEKGSPPISV